MQNFESYVYLILLLILLGAIAALNQKPKRKTKKHIPRGIKTSTANGELVKSKAEARIANFLKNKNISYVYEKPLLLAGRTIKPDFYLEKYDTYIEYYGWYGEKYRKDKKAKMESYKRNKIKVISLFREEYRYLENSLSKELFLLKFFWFVKNIIKSIKSVFHR